MPVKPIPDGYHSLTPYIMVGNIEDYHLFLKHAFGAAETERLEGGEGKILHLEMCIGDSIIMLGQAPPEMEPLPASLYMYCKDVDEVYARALESGAESMSPPEDQFYGDRTAGVRDPYGGMWWLATHIEDIPPDEMERRAMNR